MQKNCKKLQIFLKNGVLEGRRSAAIFCRATFCRIFRATFCRATFCRAMFSRGTNKKRPSLGLAALEFRATPRINFFKEWASDSLISPIYLDFYVICPIS
jgi:hypothetical protein